MAVEARRRGRPAFEPNKDHRAIVTAMVAGGTEHQWIAEYLRINISTLKKYFKEELRRGAGIIGARLNASAIQKALAGDRTMLIFVLKTKFGWRETERHQFIGKNDQPINFDSLDAHSLAQVIAALEASVAVGGSESEP